MAHPAPNIRRYEPHRVETAVLVARLNWEARLEEGRRTVVVRRSRRFRRVPTKRPREG